MVFIKKYSGLPIELGENLTFYNPFVNAFFFLNNTSLNITIDK